MSWSSKVLSVAVGVGVAALLSTVPFGFVPFPALVLFLFVGGVLGAGWLGFLVTALVPGIAMLLWRPSLLDGDWGREDRRASTPLSAERPRLSRPPVRLAVRSRISLRRPVRLTPSFPGNRSIDPARNTVHGCFGGVGRSILLRTVEG